MKKLLSLLLALTLVLSMGVAAFADEFDDHDPATPHGTAGEAQTGSGSSTNGSASSTFYLTIDKDSPDNSPDPLPIGEKDKTVKDEDDNLKGVVYYVVSEQSAKKDSLSFTVPLFVCMYAYGGSGRVITPTGAAYQIENSSVRQYSQKISEIVQYNQVFDDLATLRAAVGDATLANNTGKPDNGDGYAFYVTFDDSYSMTVNAIADGLVASIWYDADGDGKSPSAAITPDNVDEDDTAEIIKVAKIGSLKTTKNSDTAYIASAKEKDSASGTYTNFYVGKSTRYSDSETVPGDNDAPKRALALKVSTLLTKVNNTGEQWSLIPKDEETILAKQIKMSINGVDLYGTQASVGQASPNGLDIISLNWNVPAAERIDSTNGFDNDTSATGKLQLPVSAVIAGDGKNVDNDTANTDTAVLTVSYTLIPTD